MTDARVVNDCHRRLDSTCDEVASLWRCWYVLLEEAKWGDRNDNGWYWRGRSHADGCGHKESRVAEATSIAMAWRVARTGRAYPRCA